jgi:DNA-binding transcriptional MerR regulator
MALLTIGDFSRMTHLSVKALRHYHEVGLLEPASVDPGSGYRLYQPAQVTTAQVIRRFRDLGMPIDEVKAVLDAPDVSARNKAIVAHLERMEQQLADTQATVASLRVLLEREAPEPMRVEYRTVGACRSLAIREEVTLEHAEEWWAEAFAELYDAARAAGVTPAGPSGALWSGEWFEWEVGEVTAFVPVDGNPAGSGRAEVFEVPAAELAVAEHRGSFADIDQTYAALGTFVADREIGVDGPIREYYIVSPLDTDDASRHRIEVGWPIFRTRS